MGWVFLKFRVDKKVSWLGGIKAGRTKRQGRLGRYGGREDKEAGQDGQ